MTLMADGPASALFQPVRVKSRQTLRDLERAAVTDELRSKLSGAPRGSCVCRGIPFLTDRIVIVSESPATIALAGLKARWLVFLHASDGRPLETNAYGFHSPMKGEGRLGELACTYRIRYGDGTEAALPIRRRHQIGCFTKRWGENCFEAVPYRKPRPVRASHEQLRQGWDWSQTRVDAADDAAFSRGCTPGRIPSLVFRWNPSVSSLPWGRSFSSAFRRDPLNPTRSPGSPGARRC